MGKIEQIIKSNNIIVLDKHIDGVKGAYIKYRDLNIITLEPTLTSNERAEVLRHEIGHFLIKATYNINETDVEKIQLIESRVESIEKMLNI